MYDVMCISSLKVGFRNAKINFSYCYFVKDVV